MFSLTPWRERREVDRLRREMDSLFDRFFEYKPVRFTGEEAHFMPSVDVSETEKEVLVKAELPGMDPKDIDVSVQGRLLSIRGERKQESEQKGELLTPHLIFPLLLPLTSSSPLRRSLSGS